MYSGQLVSDFRTRFNELFNESGKTNTDLGKDLHVSNQTISAWRLGVRSPKLPTVSAIAAFFGVSTQWLVGYDVQKEPFDPRTDGPQQQRIPIVVPDSERFIKLVRFMKQEEYVMVMEAFRKAEKRLREAEERENDTVQTGD